MKAIYAKFILLVLVLVALIGLRWFLFEPESPQSSRGLTEEVAPRVPKQLIDVDTINQRLTNIVFTQGGPAVEPNSSARTIPVGLSTETNKGALAQSLKPASAQSAGTSAVPQRKGVPLTDPLARMALALVGEDEVATEYWLDAVNDPTIPPEERKDLLEDLNEDGFVDPKHPTASELPLILNRLALLEAMAPFAMDSANAAAIAEAYKDLSAMAQGLPHD